MQTVGVHTRDVRRLGARGLFSLFFTLGFTLVSAALHALALAWIAAAVLVAVVAGLPPSTPVFALSVLFTGTAAALMAARIGAIRAGVPYDATDMILSPIYWSLLTIAFGHAAWRLIRDPFTWDKTPHRPSRLIPKQAEPICQPASAGRRAA